MPKTREMLIKIMVTKGHLTITKIIITFIGSGKCKMQMPKGKQTTWKSFN